MNLYIIRVLAYQSVIIILSNCANIKLIKIYFKIKCLNIYLHFFNLCYQNNKINMLTNVQEILIIQKVSEIRK